MTWEFGGERNLARLLEYEWRLEELFRRRPELDGICQYHRDTLPAEAMRQSLLAHQTIFINETLSRISPVYVQSGLPAEQRPANRELDELVNQLCQVADSRS